MIYKLKKITFLIFGLSIYTFIVGCSVKSPIYQSDNNLSNKLNNYELQTVNVEKTYNGNLINSDKIALRGANLVSSYGGNFQDYLEESLKIQLSQNDLYDTKSDVTIKTELLLNNVSIWGFSEANYNISAKFIINKKGKIVYETTKTIIHNFPSHFVGQIAIERGIDNYPIAVQKLIADFLNDSYVLESLKLDRK